MNQARTEANFRRRRLEGGLGMPRCLGTLAGVAPPTSLARKRARRTGASRAVSGAAKPNAARDGIDHVE